MSDVLKEFAEEFKGCWLCGTSRAWPALQIHHIARGVHRKKAGLERCVLIRCCPSCHDKYLDSMPIAMQLAIKRANDPKHYNRVLVNRLRCRDDNAITESEVSSEGVKLLRATEAATEFPFPGAH